MTSFSSMRRDSLCAGSLGTLGEAFAVASLPATDRQGTGTPTSLKGVFDIRAFGASGESSGRRNIQPSPAEPGRFFERRFI